jgi:hypothetical protein
LGIALEVIQFTLHRFRSGLAGTSLPRLFNQAGDIVVEQPFGPAVQPDFVFGVSLAQ